MKVHLIKKQSIEDYAAANARSRPSFGFWLGTVKYAEWCEPDDIKGTFGTADLLGNGTNRVVFNIGGNNYRMICKYHFGTTKVRLFVCWIGTHAQYTALCREGRQYDIHVY